MRAGPRAAACLVPAPNNSGVTAQDRVLCPATCLRATQLSSAIMHAPIEPINRAEGDRLAQRSLDHASSPESLNRAARRAQLRLRARSRSDGRAGCTRAQAIHSE